MSLLLLSLWIGAVGGVSDSISVSLRSISSRKKERHGELRSRRPLDAISMSKLTFLCVNDTTINEECDGEGDGADR